MDIKIRQYSRTDTEAAVRIWNHIVEEGVASPQIESLMVETGKQFSSEQSPVGIMYDGADGDIMGLYVPHPNNVGRCDHICNASYAVKSELRGRYIGETLVKHCMKQGKKLGLRVLQFSVAVRNNVSALHMYEKLEFVQLGVIPGGFPVKGGSYEDIIPHYHVL